MKKISMNKRPVLGVTRSGSNLRIEGLWASPPWSLPLGSYKYSDHQCTSMQAPGNSTETEHNGHQVSLLPHEREGAKLPSQSPFPGPQIQMEVSMRGTGALKD